MIMTLFDMNKCQANKRFFRLICIQISHSDHQYHLISSRVHM